MKESLPIHDRLQSLQAALLAYRMEGQGELFSSRDVLRELGDWIAGSAFSSLQPIFEIALEVLGKVIRHGNVDKEDALFTVESLVKFVDAAVTEAAADRPQTLGMAGVQPVVARTVPEFGVAGLYHPHASVEDRRSENGEVAEQEVQLDAGAVDETRLGEILLQMKLVSKDDLTRALSLQQVTRRRLGEILLSMGILDEVRLHEALERQRFVTLRMANGRASGRGGLELRVAHPDFLNQAGRTDSGLSNSG